MKLKLATATLAFVSGAAMSASSNPPKDFHRWTCADFLSNVASPRVTTHFGDEALTYVFLWWRMNLSAPDVSHDYLMPDNLIRLLMGYCSVTPTTLLPQAVDEVYWVLEFDRDAGFAKWSCAQYVMAQRIEVAMRGTAPNPSHAFVVGLPGFDESGKGEERLKELYRRCVQSPTTKFKAAVIDIFKTWPGVASR